MPSIVYKGPSSALVEQPESGQYEFGEKATQTRVYRGLYSLCLSSALSKGVIGTGNQAGYVVEKSNVTREARGLGKLTIIWEAGGGSSQNPGVNLPADTWSLDPVEINPRLEQHPLFASLTEEEKEQVRTALEGSEGERQDAIEVLMYWETLLNDLPAVLWAKRLRGMDTYYVSGLKYTWRLYSWTAPGCTSGGFIEVPGGPAASLLPGTFSWLRQSDQLSYSGTFELVRTWLGGPSGHWDVDIYT